MSVTVHSGGQAMKKEINVWDYAGRIMEAIDAGILMTTAADGE